MGQVKTIGWARQSTACIDQYTLTEMTGCLRRAQEEVDKKNLSRMGRG